MKNWRALAVAVLMLTGTAVTSAAAGAATLDGGWGHHHHHHGSAYTCTGGVIPAGSYDSVIVTGFCTAPAGNVSIAGDLTVAPGALLDAVTPGDPSSSPDVPATVTVGGNVFVQEGAVLLLGCSPNISCVPPTAGFGISFDRVGGSLDADGAQAVVVHDTTFGGDVSINGGGGGAAAQACDAQVAGQPVNTALAPWSEDSALDFIPPYFDVEDAQIGGSLHEVGIASCWLGSLRNLVGGDFVNANNTMGDPDAMEIGNNVIFRSFVCVGDSPAPQFGDGAAPDLVGGHARGQCGFDDVLPNPAPEAVAMNKETGVGINEDFVVSFRQLQRAHGTHSATNVASAPGYPATTSSGDSIFAELNDFTLTGSGLTGTATYTGGAPGQSPGEAVLGTTYPDGSDQFLAYDTCTSCSFGGQTGGATLRAYGSTSPHGNTSGFFIITSGGTLLATSTTPVPPLATLTGFGFFFGNGPTLHVVEYLGFG